MMNNQLLFPFMTLFQIIILLCDGRGLNLHFKSLRIKVLCGFDKIVECQSIFSIQSVDAPHAVIKFRTFSLPFFLKL